MSQQGETREYLKARRLRLQYLVETSQRRVYSICKHYIHLKIVIETFCYGFQITKDVARFLDFATSASGSQRSKPWEPKEFLDDGYSRTIEFLKGELGRMETFVYATEEDIDEISGELVHIKAMGEKKGKSFRFLDLPCEIRLQIYHEALQAISYIKTRTTVHELSLYTSPNNPAAPGLCLTNRFVNQEATSVLYSSNTFYFDSPRELRKFEYKIGDLNRDFVRSLWLKISLKYRAWVVYTTRLFALEYSLLNHIDSLTFELECLNNRFIDSSLEGRVANRMGQPMIDLISRDQRTNRKKVLRLEGAVPGRWPLLLKFPAIEIVPPRLPEMEDYMCGLTLFDED